ncbi:MAG: hypothetical protein WCO33_03415 [bacterium]
MGFDLINHSGEEFRWDMTFWSKALQLGEKYGWKQKGTTMPKDYEGGTWSGTYWESSHQIVEAEDANNLADALEKSIEFLPKEEIKIPKLQFTKGSATELPMPIVTEEIPIENYFSGPGGLESIKEFIEYCRKGSFEIC